MIFTENTICLFLAIFSVRVLDAFFCYDCLMCLTKNPKYLKALHVVVHVFALIGLVLGVLFITILLRPDTLELVGLEEVSSDLYSCMTYKDPALLQRIYSGEIELKEARRIANARTDIAAEYTQCLENIFDYHRVWVDRNASIIYD